MLRLIRSEGAMNSDPRSWIVRQFYGEINGDDLSGPTDTTFLEIEVDDVVFTDFSYEEGIPGNVLSGEDHRTVTHLRIACFGGGLTGIPTGVFGDRVIEHPWPLEDVIVV